MRRTLEAPTTRWAPARSPGPPSSRSRRPVGSQELGHRLCGALRVWSRRTLGAEACEGRHRPPDPAASTRSRVVGTHRGGSAARCSFREQTTRRAAMGCSVRRPRSSRRRRRRSAAQARRRTKGESGEAVSAAPLYAVAACAQLCQPRGDASTSATADAPPRTESPFLEHPIQPTLRRKHLDLLDPLVRARVVRHQLERDVESDLCESMNLAHSTPHRLRHRRISLWHFHGVPARELADRAGHATPSMSLDVYSLARDHPGRGRPRGVEGDPCARQHGLNSRRRDAPVMHGSSP